VLISVMVLSDDRLVASALEMILARQGDLCVIATDGSAEVPDIVVIEAAWSRGKAIQRTAAAREAFPGAQAIVLGLDEEDDSVIDFIEAGAVAYVLKSAQPEDLFGVIRAVARGEVESSPRMVAFALERIGRLTSFQEPVESATERLTERELEILRLLATGLQNKEIGKALSISHQTVKNHVHAVLEKLGADNRRRAVRRAFELGFLDLF
jgi:DNA-binding NarL/FixJ family response regulator